LNDIGIQSDAAGHSPVERLLGRLPKTWLQRPLLLSVRNTLRHKGRLLRTMIVLVLGTALFIAVISVRQSVDTTQADFLRHHNTTSRCSLRSASAWPPRGRCVRTGQRLRQRMGCFWRHPPAS
jgi:hypothetical protein